MGYESSTDHTDRPPLRVVVAGGRRLGRDGVAALLAADRGIEVVASSGDVLATRAAIDRFDAQVVVTHVWLECPGRGAELAVTLRDQRPEVGVVLLIGDGDAGEVRRVLDEGTAQRALLLMDHPGCARDLVHAVHEVADGGSVVHPGVVDLILRADRTKANDLPDLTPREREVLAAIASGANNRAVAEHLDLSGRAVEKHINQLYTKLGLPTDGRVHRRVAATLVALGAHGRLNGMLSPSGGRASTLAPSTPPNDARNGSAGATGASGAAHEERVHASRIDRHIRVLDPV